MDTREEARNLQRRYVTARHALRFFRDAMNNPERSPLRNQPPGLDALELEEWREKQLMQAMEEAETLARAWMSRHPEAILEFHMDSAPRGTFLGFRSKHPIPPGCQERVISRPQLHMIPVELCLPPHVAEAFRVLDIRAGNYSAFVSSDPVPGLAFLAREIACHLQFPPALVAMDYTWIVENVSDKAITFEASFKGPVMEP